MKTRMIASIAALGLGLLSLWTHANAPEAPAADGPPQTYAEFVQALQPRRANPVVAILAHPQGTETTDFLVPHALLRRAGVQVVAVSPVAGPIPLMPALGVQVELDFAAFATRFPQGPDYVLVPAMHRSDDPQLLAWLQAQQQRGATIIGICAGAQVLAHAGLLDGRRFTGHWWDRTTLARSSGARYVAKQRYLTDQGVVTTTGVSASIPVTLALIEALQGHSSAASLAHSLGEADWGVQHASEDFGLDAAAIWTTVRNTLAFWQHRTIGIPVHNGSDDVALALVADAWSRTYGSQAVAVAPSPVQLASGLTLITDPAAQSNYPALPAQRPALCQLDDTLDRIAGQFGDATRRWVATQLEYAAPQGPRTGCQ
jgi:putative intracellular protease/amidase